MAYITTAAGNTPTPARTSTHSSAVSATSGMTHPSAPAAARTFEASDGQSNAAIGPAGSASSTLKLGMAWLWCCCLPQLQWHVEVWLLAQSLTAAELHVSTGVVQFCKRLQQWHTNKALTPIWSLHSNPDLQPLWSKMSGSLQHGVFL